MLGLMGAMEDEVRLIRADLDDVEELDGPCELLRGRLDGTPVVLAKCGIGKVNAALAASGWRNTHRLHRSRWGCRARIRNR